MPLASPRHGDKLGMASPRHGDKPGVALAFPRHGNKPGMALASPRHGDKPGVALASAYSIQSNNYFSSYRISKFFKSSLYSSLNGCFLCYCFWCITYFTTVSIWE
jgi:hypothetical protein